MAKLKDITIEPLAPVESESVHTAQGAIDIEAPVQAAEVPEKKKDHIGVRTQRIISNSVIYVILCIMTVIWLFPFVAVVFESFRCESTGLAGYIVPKKFGFTNYVKLFTDKEMSFGRWFLNTLVLGIATSILQTIFVLSMSYVLSRLRFKGRKALMNFMLILGMFPGFLTLILLYKVLSSAGLTQERSIFGLILVYVASSGMGYYVSKGFFDTIPKSLDEAARIDGATRAQVFVKIILPMAKPIVIYTILMGFMAPWGDFMLASYIAHGTDAGKNVAVGMQGMLTQGTIGDKWTQFCAAAVTVSIPITLLFMFMQKYYVEGVTGGAVKG